MGAPWPGPGSGPATRPAAARRAAGRGAGVSVQTGRRVPVPVRARRGQLGLRPSPPLRKTCWSHRPLRGPTAGVARATARGTTSPRTPRSPHASSGGCSRVRASALHPAARRGARQHTPGDEHPARGRRGSPTTLTAPRCPRAPLRPRSRRLRIRGLVPRRTRGAGSHRLLLAAPGSSPAASCATKSQLKLTSSGATPLTSRKQPPAPAALSHDPGHLLTVT